MARIGFQMIMLKDHSDFFGALELAAQIGYDIAEPWGWKPPVSCMEQHRLAERAGLAVCSGHYQPGLEWVGPYVDELIAQLKTAGARAWVMPGGYGGDTVEKMIASAGRLREFYLEKLAPNGMAVEYHNHSADIKPMFDGKTQVDLLLEHVPELGFQPDIGNAFIGGQADTVAFLEHYGERITCLHVKDVCKDFAALERGKASCATGEGLIDVSGAIAVAKSLGVQDYIVEQEGVADDAELERVLRDSYETVAALL